MSALRWLPVMLALAPAVARADDAKGVVVRKTIVSDAKPPAVEKAACSIQPNPYSALGAGSFDVRVGGHRCATDAPSDASSDDVREAVGDVASSRAEALARPGRSWYGWQTLVAVGATATPLALAGLVFAFQSPGSYAAVSIAMVGFPLAVAGVVLSGPIVHWAHGRVGHGFAILGATLGVAALSTVPGALLTCAAASCGGDSGGVGAAVGMSMGAALGTLGVAIYDVATSYEDRPRAPATPTVAPTVAMQRGGAVIGLGGTF